MKSLSGLLPVLAIFLSLDSVRARPQANGQPISGVGIVEKVERVNLHEKVNSSGSNNRYFTLESYSLHNGNDSKCKAVLNRRNFKNFTFSPEMKSFFDIILNDTAISEMLILANKSQAEKNENINRFFEIIDKYRISKSKPRLDTLFVIFKWYLRNCKAFTYKDIYRCTCGHFKTIDGSREDKNQTREMKPCTFFMKVFDEYEAVGVIQLKNKPSSCIVLNLKLAAHTVPTTLQYKNIEPYRNNTRHRKPRTSSSSDDDTRWIPISVSSRIKRLKNRETSDVARTPDDEIVQQFFETSIPALKSPLIEKPVLPESLDELILLHTLHGAIKPNVDINGHEEPLTYPPSYSTTLSTPGIVVNNAIEHSTTALPYPTSSSTICPPSYDYPKPDLPLEWPIEQTKPSQNYGESPTFVEPVNVPVNFLPSTDDASPLNPITGFNGQPSPAILVIGTPSDQSLEDIAGEVVADDAIVGAAGGGAGAGALGAAAAGAAAAGAGAAAAAGGAAAAGAAAASAAAAGAVGAGAGLGAGAVAAAGAAGVAVGAAAGVAAGAAAGVAAGATAGLAVGAATGAVAGAAAGGGGGIGGGNVAGGGLGGGGGGGSGVLAIDQTGAAAALPTTVATAGGDDGDMSLMDYLASIFGGMNILNPIGFTFWSMMFAPLSIILTSGLSMFAFLFPWLFPALWFGRSTATHRAASWYSPSGEPFPDVETLAGPYLFGYERDTAHSSSIPINRKHVRKRRKRRAILVV